VGWHCPACGEGVLVAPEGVPLFAPKLADTDSGFNPVALTNLAAVEDAHFWFIARNKLIVGLTHRFFPATKRYLEIGRGMINHEAD
jgi:hypothetical protein